MAAVIEKKRGMILSAKYVLHVSLLSMILQEIYWGIIEAATGVEKTIPQVVLVQTTHANIYRALTSCFLPRHFLFLSILL